MLTQLTPSIGLLFLPLYFAITIVIGWISRRRGESANAYLNATHSLPLWIVTAAYLAANCGALEIVGLSAMAAQYGVQAFHFYLIGAIPAMIFLAIWMMPLYNRGKVRSVPHYLELRYGKLMRLLNACVVAIVMLLLAGVNLYAMGQVLTVVLGFSFFGNILACASVVMVYVLLGGVRATIYNEVFQLLVIGAGLVPLCIRSARILMHSAPTGAGSYIHLWKDLPYVSMAAPLDRLGITFGLGFVLSFGYWCTDFVLMQRALSARTESAARQVPLWAGFGKLIFAFIVVLPGLAVRHLFPTMERFDEALPLLMKTLYSPLMLYVGLTALTASLMSGFAANLSAFAALWTEDIYHAWLRPGKSETHYLSMGQRSIVVATVISIVGCYLNFLFRDLMEYVQLIFSVFGSPFWAIFLLGMTVPRVGKKGAIFGFLSGVVISILHLVAVSAGWLHYGSMMNANFHAALYAFLVSCAVALLCARRDSSSEETSNIFVFNWKSDFRAKDQRVLWILAVLLLGSCAFLNYRWN